MLIKVKDVESPSIHEEKIGGGKFRDVAIGKRRSRQCEANNDYANDYLSFMCACFNVFGLQIDATTLRGCQQYIHG
jgi:hypothetical protein